MKSKDLTSYFVSVGANFISLMNIAWVDTLNVTLTSFTLKELEVSDVRYI